MSNLPLDPEKRIESVEYAFEGMWTVLRNERNAWIHAGVTVVVVTLGVILQVSRQDWGLLILAMVGVWMGESLNTAVEAVVDMTTDGKNRLLNHHFSRFCGLPQRAHANVREQRRRRRNCATQACNKQEIDPPRAFQRPTHYRQKWVEAPVSAQMMRGRAE